MTKRYLRMISIATLAMACSAPAYAAPYILNYTGTTFGTGTPFTAILNLDLASNGAVATLINGTRDGVAITSLSSFASADNRLSFNNPYVSLGGLSYTVTGGTMYNFYYDAAGTSFSPPGAAGYGDLNSVTNPGGNSGGVTSRVTFASVNGVVITPSVPEPASWALMVLGMGAVGYALRRKVRASEINFDAKIKRIATGTLA